MTLAKGVLTALVLAAVLLAAWLIDRSPETFLDYLRVLAWPVVALIGVLIFRRPLGAMFEGVVLKALGAGSVRAEFAVRTADQPAEIDFDWEAFVDEDGDEFVNEDGAEDSEVQELRAALELRELANEVLWTYLQAFQSQVDFLRYLRDAPDGVDPEVAVRWFEAYITVQFGSTAGFDFAKSIGWLTTNRLVVVSHEGRYVITAVGEHVAAVPDHGWTAPKAM
jgi:hypothetical protein